MQKNRAIDMKNVPKIIYLQVCGEDNHNRDFKDLDVEFVTWSTNKDYPNDIKYIREPSNPQWISVSESLPEKDGIYLVCFDDKYICTNTFYPGSGFNNMMSDMNVTHWMPLPEPPQPLTTGKTPD